MPSRTKTVDKTALRGMFTMPPDSPGSPARAAPTAAAPSDTEACELAVQAIWRSLDEHCLVDGRVRRDLALVLEPLTPLIPGDRLQRLVLTLRLPDPIDASRLYWLTRRLLTIVPELQAAGMRFSSATDH